MTPLLRQCSRFLTVTTLTGALVAACAPSSPAEAQDRTEGSPATQASRLVTRWTIIVSERFERARAFKSDSTDELIDQFLSVGAVRAVREHAAAEALRAADEAVDRFAIAMIGEGERREDGSTEVTDEAVVTGRNSVCPSYPFC